MKLVVVHDHKYEHLDLELRRKLVAVDAFTSRVGIWVPPIEA